MANKQTGSIDLNAAKNLGDIATDTAQYFWFTSGGSDNGAHITEIDKETFQNTPAGGNLLATSNGIAVREALNELASFGSNGAIIGEIANNKTRAEITPNSMELIKRNNLGTDKIISHNGYGTVNTTIEGGGTGDGPYFTLFFSPGYVPGKNSVSIGSAIASAKDSFAMGDNCAAKGECSFAMGEDCQANGNNSVCLNLYNTANGDCQTVIGRYNKPDAAAAFIIGNGDSPAISDLSNMLIVDWNGNLDIVGNYKINGAQIGSVMRLKGSSYSSPLSTSYKTLNLSTTAEINTGNAFTASSNGIKCAYAGTVHLIGKVRFNDSFTANDYMVAQIYNTTQSTAIQTGRMRTPTQVFNGDVWVDAYARVNANDVLLLRAENATGGRGTVTIGECSLTACYISS